MDSDSNYIWINNVLRARSFAGVMILFLIDQKISYQTKITMYTVVIALRIQEGILRNGKNAVPFLSPLN